MADVTPELTARYKEWSHAEMLQEIADIKAQLDEACDGRGDAILEQEELAREIKEAEEKVEGARLDGIYAAVEVLKTEARYHNGIAGGTGRSPIGNLYAAAVKDVEREAPQFVGQLL